MRLFAFSPSGAPPLARPALLGLVLLFAPCLSGAAVLTTLRPSNWDEFAPAGKEADAIYGDYVLRNDRIVAVVANPDLISGRSASRIGVQYNRGNIIDLTLRDAPNDQLTGYYPGVRVHYQGSIWSLGTAAYRPDYADDFEPRTGPEVTLEIPVAPHHPQRHHSLLRYTLADGWPYVRVEVVYTNPVPAAPAAPKPERAGESDEPVPRVALDRDGVSFALPAAEPAASAPRASTVGIDLRAQLRADHTFECGVGEDGRLAWAYDRWFGQAYGVWAENHSLNAQVGPLGLVLTPAFTGGRAAELRPGEGLRVVRRVFPARDLLHLRALVAQLGGEALRPVKVRIAAGGAPVAAADVRVLDGAATYGWGRTSGDGSLAFMLPRREFTLRVQPFGRREQVFAVPAEGPVSLDVQASALGSVAVEATDEDGTPLPCKVAFYGLGETPDPDFFPASGSHRVRNLCYTHTGSVRQELSPGAYEVAVSHGPEYDAHIRTVEVRAGGETTVRARLARRVNTAGWISADLHTHTTRSGVHFHIGASTADPLGRVLNLLCEQVEFAPATEHNRVSTYAPLIEALGAGSRLATCTGIGLADTGKYAFNEQNAFPIEHHPRWQDGGAPQRPQHCGQIEWLRSWGVEIDPDEPWQAAKGQVGYDKLLVLRQDSNADAADRPAPIGGVSCFGGQDVATWWTDDRAVTKPLFRDCDDDGRPDRVYHGFARQMDALDVGTLESLIDSAARRDNDVLDWRRMRELGYRMPAVCTSGAYDNYHGCGGVRGYVRSRTDDPSRIDPLDVLREVRAGHVIMTTGPFLEATAVGEPDASGRADVTGPTVAFPGDTLASATGRVRLHVRVQCPNWIQADRVQVRLAGMGSDLEFTRETTPEAFSMGDAVQFEREIPLSLTNDTQVLVLAFGSGPNLRHRSGPDDAVVRHAALINPILVDLGGDGFVPISPVEEEIETRLELVRPLRTGEGGPPAQVRLTLVNHGSNVVEDVVLVDVRPGNVCRVPGGRGHPFRVEGGGETRVEFDVTLTEEARLEAMLGEKVGATLYVLRSARPPGIAPAKISIRADDSPDVQRTGGDLLDLEL